MKQKEMTAQEILHNISHICETKSVEEYHVPSYEWHECLFITVDGYKISHRHIRYYSNYKVQSMHVYRLVSYPIQTILWSFENGWDVYKPRVSDVAPG